MIALVMVFYLFLTLFGIIGSMRGWAKELLVIFSIIVALSLIWVLENLIPVVNTMIKSNEVIRYWVRTGIVLSLTFFGYQSPKFSRLAKAAERRDRIQDTLLGLILGVLSGYFVIGSLWHYASQANYPALAKYISEPNADALAATRLVMGILPPVWLGVAPNVIIAVVMAFIFVIVVFL